MTCPPRALAAACLAAACQSASPEIAPRPLPTPALEVTTELRGGDVLEPAPLADESPAAAFRVRLLYVERPRARELDGVPTHARLVADLSGEEPIPGVAHLLGDARVGVADAARAWIEGEREGRNERVVELFSGDALVPHDATWSLDARAEEYVEDPLDWLDEFEDRGPFVRRVGVSLSLPAAADADGAPRLALAVDDLDPDVEREREQELLLNSARLPEPPPHASDEALRHETALLDLVPEVGEPLVAVIPSPFDTGRGRAFAVVIERVALDAGDGASGGDGSPVDTEATELAAGSGATTEPVAPDDGSAAAASETSDGSSAPAEPAPSSASRPTATTDVARTPAATGGDGGDASTVDATTSQAVRAFEKHASRAALLLVADASRSALLTDVALVGSTVELERLADALAADGERRDARALAWALETRALEDLCSAALAQSLSPEREAVLQRAVGALVSLPDVVVEAVRASRDRASFTQRVVEENVRALAAPDAALRVRAHDWLARRGAAVQGFDPLASADARRAALARRGTEDAP